MSRNRAFCFDCSQTTEQDYEYQRYEKGSLVIRTCTKCGKRTESFRRYQD